MKALVYTAAKSLKYREADEPARALGDNLIEIGAVGICGSDMHAYLGHDPRRTAPLILGHEAAGLVVDGPMVGKRVTINPLVTCATCDYCNSGRQNLCQSRQIISMAPRQGAFAQRIAMPSSNLIEVPDPVSWARAAMAEPLAVCLHAAKLARDSCHAPLAHAKCLVIGGGAIGVGSALALSVLGAQHIALSEPNPLRRDFARALNVCGIYDPETHGRQAEFDIIVDAVGFAQTRAQSCELVKPGGVITHIGLGDDKDGLDVRRLTLQEITFIGTYTYTAQDFTETAQAIFDGQFGALDWMEQRALADGATAFADILAGTVAAPKVILRP